MADAAPARRGRGSPGYGSRIWRREGWIPLRLLGLQRSAGRYLPCEWPGQKDLVSALSPPGTGCRTDHAGFGGTPYGTPQGKREA